MNCYFLKETPSKARKDVDQIIQGMGFKNIAFPRPSSKNKVIDFFITFASAVKALFPIQKGDVLLLPYNIRKYYVYLCKIAHMRGAKVVTLIHDLSSFYRKHITAKEEIKRLSYSDYLIAHNEVMKKWLEDNGCKQPIGVLGIFDYLSDKEPIEKPLPSQPYKVLYAGTLSSKKNKFLYDLEDYIHSYRFSLYGGGFDLEAIKKKELFTYHGFVSSDTLVASADGDFGLVWDGNSIYSCDGPRGAYMQINNPHKFSLYMRCGLPVIIWEKAAMAAFVRTNKVGICISSLDQLNDSLSKITPEEYAEMKRNAMMIGKRLSEGYYFKRAYEEALSRI
ncbi:galactofuranosyltransferase [Bacteroides sp. 519]|uniref:galactofuranosyltransferase n=1 Tax=Bacteroides sp. 519 TaxID=2302937 RepID=UPI0013D6F9E5|nr:galactofuranosyltransferase [Bacteroides sp. 519]NDV58035.1 galactofuranosyltransferase [Bacteroides sp. 519]